MENLSDRDIIIRTHTTVELLNQRLFGHDGQPGAIPYLNQQHTELAKKLDDEVDKLKEKDSYLDSKITWYAGGIAALGTAATFILGWFGIHSKG